jgi:Outer membrane protein beta-barrel domain
MNKKTIVGLFFLLFSARAGKSQNLSFGPMVGLNITTLKGINNSSSKAGLLAGGFFNYSSKNWFGVGIQVLYNEMGAKLSNSTEAINLNYLQVPILATYYFKGKNNVGAIRPKLFVGPHLNILSSVKNIDGNNLNPMDLYYSNTEMGITIGGGINYSFAKKIWLNVDFRYGIGLTNAWKNDNNKITNSGFGITAGVSFPLKSI